MLSDTLHARLEEMTAQARDLNTRMLEPEVASDHVEYARLNRELSALKKTVDLFGAYCQSLAEAAEAKKILADGSSDADERELAEMQLPDATEAAEAKAEAVKRSLVSEDPDDHRNAIVEVRAGAGGDEAALFAADLLRMYQLLAGRVGWSVDLMEGSGSEQGG